MNTQVNWKQENDMSTVYQDIEADNTARNIEPEETEIGKSVNIYKKVVSLSSRDSGKTTRLVRYFCR